VRERYDGKAGRPHRKANRVRSQSDLHDIDATFKARMQLRIMANSMVVRRQAVRGRERAVQELIGDVDNDGGDAREQPSLIECLMPTTSMFPESKEDPLEAFAGLIG
jgi:hypothetical protein